MNQPLANQVILVTGGGRGLGYAVASELAQAGARLILTDLDHQSAQTAADKINQNLNKTVAEGVGCDARDDACITTTIKTIEENHGHLDALINNAGINVTADIESISTEDWDRTLNTNLRGPFVMTKLALPLLKKSSNPTVINIVSSLAKRIKENSPAYVASKWGLLGLSQILYLQLKKHNVRVTALSPAQMRTRFLLDRYPELDQNKLLDPQEVAKVVRFILELPPTVAIPDLFMTSLNEETWP